DRQLAIADITIRLNDLKTVLEQTEDQKISMLRNIAYDLPEWQREIHLQKSIYHTLNKFTYDSSGNFVIAECWVPDVHFESVKEALQKGSANSGTTIRPIINVLSTNETPPTYNRVNKFTAVFQSIVDSYGIACYREMNPAPYIIITFPFLFAVMFGDVGHGLVLILAALAFIYYEKMILSRRIRDEIFGAFFGGRYIILLMGLFSLYTGAIYNDAFSKSFNIFGSGCFFNHKHKSSYVDILTNFIPQLVFLSVIFVYLCIQIVAKWIYYWVVPDVVFGYNYPGSHCAPSLLIGLINMFMFKPRAPQFTNVTIFENETLSAEYPQCHLAQWYPNQQFVESILVAIAFVCVPIMLFGKPICNKIFHRKKPRLVVHRKPPMGFKVQIESEEIELIPATNDIKNGKIIEAPVEVEEDEHEGADMMVHQAIHTIEFVLGCISHTASYLRLWALSLAHSQLSEVMWHMILAPSFKVDGILGAIVLSMLFFIFTVMTVSILVLMEGLSAFLHAIRLHWVEFQSKFYVGTGKAFVPFNLHLCLEKFCKETEVL
uniref:V-type proton ATPase subunit a n=2 Tax=Panagrolaimus sp. PS1159 TaxID=55785 RepID=A0AC35FMI1_9BILA